MAPGGKDISVVLVAVVAVGRTISTLLIDKAGSVEIVIGALVVGEILCEGVRRVEGKPLCHAMRDFCLQGMVVGLGRGTAIRDGIEVRERECGTWLVGAITVDELCN